MEVDLAKIDEAVLALLHLTLHDEARAWKSFDWDALNRLHGKGYISNPVGKAKSVLLTEEGLRESERLFYKLFAKK
jgi:predicted GNAT superfamily acetyltransferase